MADRSWLWCRGFVASVALIIALLGCEAGDDTAGASTGDDMRTGSLRWLQREWRGMKKYEWLASNSAPSGCPMELVDGEFIFPNKGSLYIPHTTVHQGWGQKVSLHVVGADTKSLPDSMNITFYSYLEDKFYRGSFQLPHERIADLFAEGFTLYPFKRPPQQITYNAIVAGVAPGGAVSVWVSGIRKQVEVFFGHAMEASLDWHTSMRMPEYVERETVRKNTIANAASTDPLVAEMQSALPLGLWASYRTRYVWQPRFEGLNQPIRVDAIKYLNGEREYLELPLDLPAQRSPRAVPHYIEFNTGTTGAYNVTFDETEALALFPRLGRNDTPLELVFRYRPESNERTVLLRNAHESVAFEHVKIEIFAGG